MLRTRMSISHLTLGATLKATINFCSLNDHHTRVRQRRNCTNLMPNVAPRSGTKRFRERSWNTCLWIWSPNRSSASKSKSSVSTSSATPSKAAGMVVVPCFALRFLHDCCSERHGCSGATAACVTTDAALTSMQKARISGSPSSISDLCAPPMHSVNESSIKPICKPVSDSKLVRRSRSMPRRTTGMMNFCSVTLKSSFALTLSTASS
mmetsp:Transcript_6734/g.15644  ORF Transcript_6734/g.15644 Transcript_6734/m.15644 type:complete len:208 (-) Transcript_6734:298-921(-)